jgi:hypothetical protein
MECGAAKAQATVRAIAPSPSVAKATRLEGGDESPQSKVHRFGGGTLVSVVRSGMEERQSESGNHPVAKAPRPESGDESPQSKVHCFGGGTLVSVVRSGIQHSRIKCRKRHDTAASLLPSKTHVWAICERV